MFIFQSSLEAIELQQLKLNCPYPVNSGIATLYANQTETTTIEYVVAYDTDSSDYHVSIFTCYDANINATGHRIGPITPSVSVTVYTADTTNSWFDITNRASGYMFYISMSITAFFDKVVAGGNMLYLIITAPAQVTGLAFFNYIEIVLFSFIALGAFMIIRGG